MLQLKGWIVIKNHPIGVEDFVLGLEECENCHTLTTTWSKNSPKEVNNQTNNQNNVLCPPKVPCLQVLGLV